MKATASKTFELFSYVLSASLMQLLGAPCMAASNDAAATKLQAPFDAFVCMNSTFKECLDRAQSGQLKTLRAAYKELPEDYKIEDPDRAKTVATGGNNHQCDFGSIPYQQAFNPEQKAPAIFVSPVLLRQVTEDFLKLKRARESCVRLVQAYGYQHDILVHQDDLSKAQRAVAVLSAETEVTQSSGAGLGARDVPSDESDREGYTQKGAVRDIIRWNRVHSADVSRTLREDYKKQVEVDYNRQFADANLAIELQLRAMAKDLFLLDRAISPDFKGCQFAGYITGSYVRQGTVVLVNCRLPKK